MSKQPISPQLQQRWDDERRWGQLMEEQPACSGEEFIENIFRLLDQVEMERSTGDRLNVG